MAYGTNPPGNPYYRPPTVPPRAPVGTGMLLYGLLLVAYAVLELALLGVGLLRGGGGFAGSLFGIDTYYMNTPFAAYSQDLAVTGILVACVVGAFTGRAWARAASMSLIGALTYANLTLMIQILSSSSARDDWSNGWYAVTELIGLGEVLLGAAILVAGAVAARPPAAPAPGYPAVVPPQPGYAYPQDQYQQQAPPPGYGYPEPPPAPPRSG